MYSCSCNGLKEKLKNIRVMLISIKRDAWRNCVQLVSREVVIEPKVKLRYILKFCYLFDTLGAGRGVKEAVKARMRCAWANFKDISPILCPASPWCIISHKRKDIEFMCRVC